MFLETYFQSQETFSDEAVNVITESLLLRGKNLLARYADMNDLDEKTVMSELARIETDLLLFSRTFRVAVEEAESRGVALDFRDIAGTKLERIAGPDVSEDDQQQLRAIEEVNRQEYSAELRQKVMKEFSDSFLNAQSTFYILRFEGKPTAFLRFDMQPKTKRAYVGSLNVHPELRSDLLGTTLLRETIALYNQAGIVLEGVVHPEKKQQLEFLERELGFQVVGEDDRFGERYLKLERRPTPPADQKAE